MARFPLHLVLIAAYMLAVGVGSVLVRKWGPSGLGREICWGLWHAWLYLAAVYIGLGPHRFPLRLAVFSVLVVMAGIEYAVYLMPTTSISGISQVWMIAFYAAVPAVIVLPSRLLIGSIRYAPTSGRRFGTRDLLGGITCVAAALAVVRLAFTGLPESTFAYWCGTGIGLACLAVTCLSTSLHANMAGLAVVVLAEISLWAHPHTVRHEAFILNLPHENTAVPAVLGMFLLLRLLGYRLYR